jgi:hypothetical protein
MDIEKFVLVDADFKNHKSISELVVEDSKNIPTEPYLLRLKQELLKFLVRSLVASPAITTFIIFLISVPSKTREVSNFSVVYLAFSLFLLKELLEDNDLNIQEAKLPVKSWFIIVFNLYKIKTLC